VSTESEIVDQGEHAVADVDRIRDIIFGPQMRRYDQQLKRMAGQMEALTKQVEKHRTALDQEQVDQQERMREFQQAARQQQGELRKAQDELRGDLTGRLEQHSADTKDQIRQLTKDVRQQGQELRNEFTAALKDLETEMANRHNLGDLLIEMGMRLKEEGGIVELLEQLEQATEPPPEE
jgi:uncharacterized protein YhaN